LFGEWCSYKHSILYDKLPDYFIAFDIYIKSQQKFVSRKELEKRLEGTGISIIRKISEGKTYNKQQLLELLNTSSVYRATGYVEGVYLRIDKGDWNDTRGKIVRPDFVQGIEDHWQSQTLEKNQVKYY